MTTENIMQHFLDFAAGFEKTFADDDWTRLECYFAEDASYSVTGGPPLGGCWEGRSALLAHLQDSLNELDRRLDVRKTEILGAPTIEASSIAFDWRGTYELAGKPDLVIEGRETAVYRGGVIHSLEDAMREGDDQAMQEYLAKYFS